MDPAVSDASAPLYIGISLVWSVGALWGSYRAARERRWVDMVVYGGVLVFLGVAIRGFLVESWTKI